LDPAPADNSSDPSTSYVELDRMHCKTCFPTITLAPNPSPGSFFLRLALQQPVQGRFFILNSQGKLLQERSLLLESGQQEVEWDLHNKPNGLYWVRIVIGDMKWGKALVL